MTVLETDLYDYAKGIDVLESAVAFKEADLKDARLEDWFDFKDLEQGIQEELALLDTLFENRRIRSRASKQYAQYIQETFNKTLVPKETYSLKPQSIETWYQSKKYRRGLLKAMRLALTEERDRLTTLVEDVMSVRLR